MQEFPSKELNLSRFQKYVIYMIFIVINLEIWDFKNIEFSQWKKIEMGPISQAPDVIWVNSVYAMLFPQCTHRFFVILEVKRSENIRE